MEKTYNFGEETITVAADLTVDQVRDIWCAVHPSIRNATAVQMEDGSVRFEVMAGTKGADKTYQFGEETIAVAADLTVDQVRDIWCAVHPSIRNATAVQMENGNVRFEVMAGTKG